MKLQKVRRVISAELGELPLKENGGTFTASAFARETQNAETHENMGYVENARPAELQVTLNATIDPSEFESISADTLTVFLDGGGQHVMPRAWVTEPVSLSGGEMQVTWQCGKSQRLV